MNIAEPPETFEQMALFPHTDSIPHPVSATKTMNTAVSSQALSPNVAPIGSDSPVRSGRALVHPPAHKCIPEESPAAFIVQELSSPWPWLQPGTYSRVISGLNSQLRRFVAACGLL